jgi:hypothetical protein
MGLRCQRSSKCCKALESWSVTFPQCKSELRNDLDQLATRLKSWPHIAPGKPNMRDASKLLLPHVYGMDKLTQKRHALQRRHLC